MVLPAGSVCAGFGSPASAAFSRQKLPIVKPLTLEGGTEIREAAYRGLSNQPGGRGSPPQPAPQRAAIMALQLEKQNHNGAQTAPKRVLIVEDNELNMKLFNDLLEAHGYYTLQTKDGVEALRMARTHRPDLILMDIQLPEVSGLEVTKWLKEDDELRSIPIIAVTAFAMKGDEQKIRDGGCEAYIAKPISVASFMSTVERFLS
jgi:two-component system cell cycle response regulator DivK